MSTLSDVPGPLVEVHTRLFISDVRTLRQIAKARGTSLHIELRLLVHRSLKGERREVVVLKEQP